MKGSAACQTFACWITQATPSWSGLATATKRLFGRSSTGSSEAEPSPTESMGPERDPRSESSILGQRRSCFTQLSPEAKARARQLLGGRGEDRRAFLVCCRVLPDKELIRLLEQREIHVRHWPRPTYRIGLRSTEPRVKQGPSWFCVHVRPDHSYRRPPVLDEAIALYLTIKYNEGYFLRTANRNIG